MQKLHKNLSKKLKKKRCYKGSFQDLLDQKGSVLLTLWEYFPKISGISTLEVEIGYLAFISGTARASIFFCCFSSDCEIPNWANEPEISSQLSQYLLQNIDTISCLFLTHNTRRVQWKFLINFSQWKIFHIYEIFRENLSTRWLLIFMMAISQSKIPKIYPVKFCKTAWKVQ